MICIKKQGEHVAHMFLGHAQNYRVDYPLTLPKVGEILQGLATRRICLFYS